MKLKEIFRKQGGIELLKQYLRGGALFTAIAEFVLLGKSRTSLEILRLAAQAKINQKLKKRYIKKLKQFDASYNDNLPHIQSKKVWVCWFQGMENAPDIVQICFESMKEHLTDREIILITSENMFDYVQFPNFVIHKWNQGKITHTHMTDLLRLELLIRYGGLWLDSTVFCSRNINEIPDYYFNSDLFMYQLLKPGRDGHASYISSWLISAKSNNKLLMATRELLYSYWRENNNMWDYFLLHDFISMVFEFYPDDWKRIVPKDNATPHILLLRLFDKFDEQMWHAVKEEAPFHKLSYKFSKEQFEIKDTFYQKVFNNV